jgi:hypothetical protein
MVGDLRKSFIREFVADDESMEFEKWILGETQKRAIKPFGKIAEGSGDNNLTRLRRHERCKIIFIRRDMPRLFDGVGLDCVQITLRLFANGINNSDTAL